MSRTRQFISGIIFGYAGQVLTTLVGLWLTPFLLFRVGQHDYGLWLVGTQLMAYLGLLDLGVVALLPRETAFATGRTSIEKSADLPVIVGETLRLVLWQMPLVALIAIIAWFTIPPEWEGLRQPLGLVLIAFVLTFPLRIFGAVLFGLQDLAFLGRLNIISFLVSTATTVAMVLAGWGLDALAFGWIVAQFIKPAASWFRLRTHFPTVLPRGLPEFRWPETRVRLISGFWVSVNQIAQVLLNGTEIVIIGKFFGPAAVVPYVCTGKLVSVLANQPQMLMASAGPALSQMRTGESRERLAQVCIALGQATLILSGAGVCIVLIVNQGFVERWVGPDQYAGFWLTALLLVSMLLRHWNLTVGYALFSFGQERRLCLTALLDGAVSIGAVLLLVRWYGLIGAPIGMIISVCLVSLPANLSALALESGVSVLKLTQPLFSWFVRFLALASAAAVVGRAWVPNTIFLLGLTAMVTATAYAAVMLPLAVRDPLGHYIRPRLFPIRAKVFRLLRVNSLG